VSSSFGTLFRITTFGESHGPGLGVVVDGCPAQLHLDTAAIQHELDREVAALIAQVAEWQAQDDANRPKAKRATALNVIKDGASTGARVTAQKVD